VERTRTYIFDLASIIDIYRCIYNIAKAGEKPLRKRVKRVASNLFFHLTFICGRKKTGEVFHGGSFGGLRVLSENPLLYSDFIKKRKSCLGGIFLHLFIRSNANEKFNVSPDLLFQRWKQSFLRGRNGLTLYVDPA